MKNYIQPGHTLTVLLAAAISSGAGRLFGNLFGVAAVDGAIADEIEVQIEGVFELPKATADTPTQFAAAYWDVADGEVTTVAADNYLIGAFTEAYGSGDVLANVRLNGITTFAEPGA